MTRSRYQYTDNTAPHFLTATINNWLPIFTRPETVNIILDSWRYLQNKKNFELYGYVILENHIHLIARSPDLSRDIQSFKSYTAKMIVDHLKVSGAARLLSLLAMCKRRHKQESTYQIWEEGSHPQQIDNETVMRQKLEYIHQNPVKRGYVSLPEYWRYSSAANYAGKSGLIDVTMDWWLLPGSWSFLK